MWQQGHSNDYFVMCLISRFILYEIVKVLLTVCTIQKLFAKQDYTFYNRAYKGCLVCVQH